jgi:hypothetical protein
VRVRLIVRIGFGGLIFKMDVLGRGVEILRHCCGKVWYEVETGLVQLGGRVGLVEVK